MMSVTSQTERRALIPCIVAQLDASPPAVPHKEEEKE